MSSRRDRQRQIAETLGRHGLGYLVGVLGLSRLVPFERGLLGHQRRAEPYTRPEHVRLAFEELGATFIKLGQILSTQGDLLPPAYQAELATLQDAAPPIPAEAVRALVAAELHGDVQSVFDSFDWEPLAAASIGQAHAATLRDGTEVVVKLRRPGVVDQVQQDLEILRDLAATASRRWKAAAGYDLVGLVGEFSQTLRAELDYLQEARNAERFAANFRDDPDVHIPRVFWETTTPRMLTLQRVRGIKISDIAALDAAGVDRRALAERATRITAKMVFEDGFFHADPHPGNFFIQDGGRIAVIDFGMVGTVDDQLRERLRRLLVALARKDPERVGTALLTLGASRGPMDRAALRDDVAGLLERYSDVGVGEIAVGRAIAELLSLARRHHLKIPRDLAFLLKMLVMDEGIAAELDPQFRIGDVLGPYARRLVTAQLSPEALVRRFGAASVDLAQLAGELPDQLRRILDMLEAGGPEVHLSANDLQRLTEKMERLSTRLVAGLLAAAVIEGLAHRSAGEAGRVGAWQRTARAFSLGAAAVLTAYAVRPERVRTR